jgi:hypothetical protein
MAERFPVPIADFGLYGGRNLNGINPGYLLKAQNIAFDDGAVRKEGGAAIYNTTGLPAAFVERSNPKNFALNDVAWNGSLLVAVGGADGTDAYIVTSTDGVTWTERTNPKNFALNGVCWNGVLSLFVAVGAADGTDAYLITSPDGITWTERANPKNFALNDIITLGSTYPGQMIAVGNADGTDAYIVTSSDGTTWTEMSNPKNFNLLGITGNTSGTTVTAVGAADGTDAYMTSSIAGGGFLFERSNPKNFGLNGVHHKASSGSSNVGVVAVGVADGSDSYILTATSGNPSTFTERANPKNFALNDVVWTGTEWIAVGAADGTDAYVVTSPDGITWTEMSNPKNFALNGVVWTGSALVAVGAADGTDAYIVTSGNIFAFTERTNPKNFALNDVAFNGEIYVAVGAADGTDAYIATSTDLATWTERSNSKNFGLNAVIWTGYKFVAIGAADGSDPYILTSDDGITWTERSVASGKNFGLNGIAYNGITLVAVGAADGSDAYILTSNDGINWTERTNPKNFALNDVVWDGGQFAAVGAADGTDAYVITSPDGITWAEQVNASNFGLNAITWDGAQLIAVGAADGTDAYILTSSDGATWTEQSNPKNFALNDVVWNGKTLVAVGAADGTDAYILTSSDGSVWAEQSNSKNFGLNAVIWDGVYFAAVGAADGTDAYILTVDYDQEYILGATYWNYNGATPKIVALDTAGRLLMDGFDGNFSTVLDSGLTVTTSTFPVFVEGGKEAAANNKKLFTFTGANAVQVLSGAGTTTADITTPPSDWATTNQPTGGLVHKNRLWGYGNANDPHRLYYSSLTSHEDFSAASGGGTLAIYPGEGEKIVNAISYKGYIIVWKYPAGIYVVDTTSTQVTNWTVDRVNEKLGGAGQGSAAVVEEDIVFIDHTGEIRLVAGITEFGDIGSRSMSDMHDISVFIRDNYYLPSNTKWRMEYYSKKRELHIGASSNSLGINDNRMVIDFNRQTPRFRNSTRDTCLYLFTRELNGVPELMSCDNLGNIWRLDQEDKNKDGLGYEASFQTTYIDFGNPTLQKNGDQIEIAFEPTGDVDIAIDVIWDGLYQETTTINLDSPSGIQPGRMILNISAPLVGSGQRCSLIFRNNNADEDFAIQGLWLHYESAGDTEEP